MSAAQNATTSRRIYERLLRLLPAEYRVAYGEPTVQTFVDLHAERGPLIAWSRALPDLCFSATLEWWARLWRDNDGKRPPIAARLAAMLIPATAVLMVAYNLLLYPANLALRVYAVGYAVTVAVLATVAVALAFSRLAAPRAVLCALATAPVWVAAFEIAKPVAGPPALLVVGVLMAVASFTRTASLRVGVRNGAVAGALSGIVFLVVTIVDGLTTMGSVGYDKVYLAEFLRSGQHSLPAYVMGERIYGALAATVIMAVFGAVIGLVTSALTQTRHTGRDPRQEATTPAD